ncbi:Os06g0190900 [Oryza sativa Japonica Group]|uniref:Os06g0190900 protein n=1 Tax=Oryza sativa subsp. japonica TaxID=39947 RepID=C7J3L4_ORYSJ|nr:Os06g0190900 [Oryza sativa Japonica Group]|eukprot:NP_001174648.1 Os06g0190900 [Oryza sativa Japonica Group]
MLKGFNVPQGKYYLVDGGYTNTPSFLASYRGVRYHLKEFGRGQQRPRNYKELFNHRHAILRSHIERAIGVLKKRFPILKVGTHHSIENQVKIPVATVVFYNLIRMLNGDEGWFNHQGSNISPEQFIDVPEGDDEYSNDVMSLNSQVDDGNTVRDMIALNMWNDYTTIFGRGSPKFNLIQAAAVQRKPSPKISRHQKKKASPKELVGMQDLKKLWLTYYMITTTTAIGDDKLCRIEGDEAVWNNIIISHPKAKKFRNKSFPLFEALGELYDVPITQPFQVPVTQPSHIPLTQPSQTSQATVTQHYMGEDENFPFDSHVHNAESDDDDLRIVEQPIASDAATRSRMGKRVASATNKHAGTSDKTEKATQRRRQDGKVVEMMGKFLEFKEKQAETEIMQQERARSNVHEDEFPIPVCIAVVDSMEDMSDDEKVLAYDVFKDPQNMAIFMIAKDSTRLKWLRRKITTALDTVYYST